MPRTRSKGKDDASGPSVTDQVPTEETSSEAVGSSLYETLTAAQHDATTGAPGVTIEQLTIERIAPHPDNPPRRHSNQQRLSELAQDIDESGVLEPAIVATRAEIVRRSPELDQRIDAQAEWVLLAGHRRWGASRLANQATLPSVVRDDLADPVEIIKVFLRENKQREDITPVEEAEAYQRLVDQGLGQRAIAKEMRTSQSNISKTLALLELPELVQTAITTGEISQHTARKLLKLPTERHEATYRDALKAATAKDGSLHSDRIDLDAAVRREEARIERETAEASARQLLSDEGIPEIDPQEKWGPDHWQHRVRDTDVATERAEGNLVGAVIEAGTPQYYSARPALNLRSAQRNDRDIETPTTTPEASEDLTLVQQRQAHRDAAAARYDACRRLLGDYSDLKPSTVIDILTDAVVMSEVESGVFRFSAAINSWLGVGYESDPELESATEDRNLAQRLAVAVALAANEDEAGQQHYAAGTPWPPVVTRHLRRLVSLGYHELSDYEHTKLSLTPR